MCMLAYNCIHGSKEKLANILLLVNIIVSEQICECPGILELVRTLCPDTSKKLS